MKPEVSMRLARRYEGLQNILTGRIVKACDQTESPTVKTLLTEYLESVRICHRKPESDIAAEVCDETLKTLANEMANECIWEI